MKEVPQNLLIDTCLLGRASTRCKHLVKKVKEGETLSSTFICAKNTKLGKIIIEALEILDNKDKPCGDNCKGIND